MLNNQLFGSVRARRVYSFIPGSMRVQIVLLTFNSIVSVHHKYCHTGKLCKNEIHLWQLHTKRKFHGYFNEFRQRITKDVKGGERDRVDAETKKKGRKEGGRGERGFREGDSTLPFLSLPLRASTTDLLGKKGELSVTKQRRNAGKRITPFFIKGFLVMDSLYKD